MKIKMNSSHSAWLPGDGVVNGVMEAAKIILDALEPEVEYFHGENKIYA